MAVTATVEVDAISCGPDGIDRPLGEPAWSIRLDEGVIADVVEVPGVADRLRVVMPVLINAHDHGRGQGTQRMGVRDAPLDQWIGAFVAAAPPNSQYDQVTTALTVMRDGGVGGVVVCVNPTTPDRLGEVRLAVSAVRDVGIRAVIAYPLTSGAPNAYRSGREHTARALAAAHTALDEIDALADEVAGDGVEIAYHPVGPQWVDEAVLEAVAAHSVATGRLVHVHLLETVRQRQWADDVYPDGIVTAFDAMGLLSERAWFAHGVHLSPAETELLAARGCGVVVNASSNLRLASGLPPLAMLTATGGPLAVGLDGMSLEDDLDMWAELRLVRGLWQAESLATVPAEEVLALATGGAPLGRARPLAVRIGNLADFVVHDLSEWSAVARLPLWPPAELILAGASRRTVREVWSGGHLVHRRVEEDRR